MQAASEWLKSFLFRPCVIKKKKKTTNTTPKLVFFCALQRQYFSGSKFKTHGLLERQDSVLACVKKNRRS